MIVFMGKRFAQNANTSKDYFAQNAIYFVRELRGVA